MAVLQVVSPVATSADRARSAHRSVNTGISDPFRFGGVIRVDRGQDYPVRTRYPAAPGRRRFGSPLRSPVGAAAAGMRFLSFHRRCRTGPFCAPPGITPGGVTCGDRDDSSTGRNLRGWPWAACQHVDPQGGRGAPGLWRRHVSPGKHSAPLPRSGPRCAGTRTAPAPRGLRRRTAGNLRVCPRGPSLEQAGLTEGGREPPVAPVARQGSSFRSRATRCTRAPWAGHSEQLAVDGQAGVRSRWPCPRAAWGARHPRAGAARFTLPRVIGG